MMPDERTCSFCKRPVSTLEFLVAADEAVGICNECVAVCLTMILNEGAGIRCSTAFGEKDNPRPTGCIQLKKVIPRPKKAKT